MTSEREIDRFITKESKELGVPVHSLDTFKMADKQKLIEVTYDLDHCNVLPEVSQKKSKDAVWSDGRLVPARSIWKVWWVVVAVTGAIFTCALVTLYFTSSVHNDDYVKFRTSFNGSSGHLVDQEVVSSGINNVIEYYITSSPNQRVTIIDDFNQDIQIIKITTPLEQFCYVATLKRDSYVRPADVIFGLKTDKDHVSQVYETSNAALDDLSILGVRGRDLCESVPTFWINPVSETNTQITVANFTSNSVSSSSSSSAISSRSKRNIRQCHTSCCWLVCCCDVHHFTWERAEHFSCVHVCHGCTRNYKSRIQKLC